MSTSDTPTPEKQDTFIDTVFQNQADFLCQHGEHLPGGATGLAKKLQHAAQEGRKLNIKLGLDPTRPDLHLGHTVVLRKLRQFQELGHNVILLIGDATALIGDPSGRNNTRPPLTEEEVKVNAQTYLDQASKVLDVSKVDIRNNSDWLYKIDFVQMLQLCSKVTVAQLLTRDDFDKRYTNNQPISFHELLYPLMQAYDSVAIDADIELGGTDQRFNLLLGRDLQSAFGKTKLQSALMMPLIEGTDGVVKMSKSYPDHCINITDTPNNMFGKLMSVPDELIMRYLKLLTNATPGIIQQMENALNSGKVNPRDIKGEMAKWVIGDIHGRDASLEAEQAFIKQFREGQIPDDIPVVIVQANTPAPVLDLMVQHQLTASKGEGKRLIEGGGLKLNGEKITEQAFAINLPTGQEAILQVGKRKYAKLLGQ